MVQLYLPVAHTEADLVLAGQIAERVDSAELYVVWSSEEGPALPEVVVELRAPGPHWSDTLALAFQAMRELVAAIFSRGPQRAAGLEPAPHAPNQETAAQ
jgi:hypothetical protein